MKLPPVPSYISGLTPYPPGKPIEELEREYGVSGSIKLASNENMLGPSPKAVRAATEALAKAHRYPDGSCYYLARAVAERFGLDPGQLVFGNGSNELINLLCTVFVSRGDEVLTSHPTFLVYQKVVQAQGGVNRVVPLKEMAHDLDGLLAAVNQKTRLIFLDNPNNPTGSIFTARAFEAFLERLPEGVVVVLDEAYIDFVEDDLKLDVRRYLDGPVPVVGLRTFSKAYGLAGFRVGYGIMAKEIADLLHRVRQPFNVNLPAQAAAKAALEDEEHYQQTLELTREGISWLSGQVKALGCTPYPSHGNFFLIGLGIKGKACYEALLSKGVIVRPMDAYGFPDCIRVTPGLPEENRRFVSALAEVLEELRHG